MRKAELVDLAEKLGLDTEGKTVVQLKVPGIRALPPFAVSGFQGRSFDVFSGAGLSDSLDFWDLRKR